MVCLCYCMFSVHVYIFFRHNTPLNWGYIQRRTHIDMCIVYTSRLYSSCRIDIRGAILYISIRSFVCLDTWIRRVVHYFPSKMSIRIRYGIECSAKKKQNHADLMTWTAHAKRQDNVALYSGTCAPTAIAHLFNRMRLDAIQRVDETVFSVWMCVFFSSFLLIYVGRINIYM